MITITVLYKQVDIIFNGDMKACIEWMVNNVPDDPQDAVFVIYKDGMFLKAITSDLFILYGLVAAYSVM